MLVLGELSWVFFRSYFRFKRFLAFRQVVSRFFVFRWLQAILDSKKQLKNPSNLIDFKKTSFPFQLLDSQQIPLVQHLKAHLTRASNLTPTKPHKRSVSEAFKRFCTYLFAVKQTQTSMDKSASQFESVGVSRSCFCGSKIKQDSANLALG